MDIKTFIEKHPNTERDEAVTYQNHISFYIEPQFTQTIYNKTFLDTNNDIFSNIFKDNNLLIRWLKSWMRPDNLKSIKQWINYPLPSSKIFQKSIYPHLKKVHDGQNSNYDYVYTEEEERQVGTEFMRDEGLDTWFKDNFNDFLYNHNAIIITDVPVNGGEPYRHIVGPGQVLAIKKGRDKQIKGLVFTETFTVEDKMVEVFYYYTDLFFSSHVREQTEGGAGDYIQISHADHKLEECPAVFLSPEPLNSKRFFLRKHIASTMLDEFKKFVVYQALFDMLLPNGAMPIVTMYKQAKEPCGKTFNTGEICNGGYLTDTSGTFRLTPNRENLLPCAACNAAPTIQAGSIHTFEPPVATDSSQKVIDLNDNFIKFHFVPPEILEWWEKNLKFRAVDIVVGMIGKRQDDNGQAKNLKQIGEIIQTQKDVLTDFGNDLAKVRTKADNHVLKLKFGQIYRGSSINNGDDFLLESEMQLLELKGKADNTLERTVIQDRIDKTKYRNDSRSLAKKQIIDRLYPYGGMTDDQFNNATVSPEDRELRNNFAKYIRMFEGEHGDILVFINTLPGEPTMRTAIQTIQLIIGDFVTVPKVEAEPEPTPVAQ